MYEAWISTVLAEGAAKAAVIPQAQIVLSAEFRKLCESNACGGYGRCWVCPPDIGEIEPLMDEVRAFSHGLLYQTISQLEDSFDIEGMHDACDRHMQLSQRLRQKLEPQMGSPVLHLSCEGCRLCKRCAKLDAEPCRHPDIAIAPLEAYGVDVYNTCAKTELRYINGVNTVTFFGMILFNEA